MNGPADASQPWRPRLVLASASPRRLALLQQVGLEPDELRPADLDESPLKGELPRSLAVRLANKAAVSGFGLFTESISGESDLLLRPGSGMLDASILRDLRKISAELPVDYFPVLELSGAKGGD